MYKVFIDDIEADINDIDINITYAISDFTTINSSKSPKSDNISLPITATNKKIFGFNDQLGTDNYSPGTGRVEKDGVIILFGTCKLLGISNTFNIQIIDGSYDWVNYVGTKKLTDIIFTSLNHTLNETNILAATSGNYIYPLVDYGFHSNVRSSKDFRPAISVEWLLNQIFTDYTISSTMLAASRDISDLYISIQDPTDYTELPEGYHSHYYHDTTQSIFNASVNGVEVIDETIDMVFNTAVIESDLYKTESSLEAFWIPYGYENAWQFRYTFYITFTGTFTVNTQFTATAIIKDDNGVEIESRVFQLDETGTTQIDVLTDSYWLVEGAAETGYYIELTVEGELETSSSQAVSIYVASAANYEVIGYESVGSGFTFDLSENMPDIKQADLLKSLRERYNLYFYLDKNTDTLYLDSQDDFYPAEGTYIDWSGKLANDTLKLALIKHPEEIFFSFKTDSNDLFLNAPELITGNTSITLTDGEKTQTKRDIFGYTYINNGLPFYFDVATVRNKDYVTPNSFVLGDEVLYMDHPVKLWTLSSGSQSGSWYFTDNSRTTFVKVIAAEFPTSTYDTWVDMQENGRLITGMFNLSEAELSQLNEKLSNMFLTSWRIIEHKGMKHLCRINKVVTNPKTNQTKVELIWY